MNRPDSVTLVIPVRNTGRFFPELLASLEAQRGEAFQRWHIDAIFIDDCSDDPVTISALASLPRNIGPIAIRIIHSDKCRGISAARNAAILESNARWISFLDSDDTLLPDGMDLRLRAIERHPDAAFVSADIYYWHELQGEKYPGRKRYEGSDLVRGLSSAANGMESAVIPDSFDAFFSALPVHTNTAMIRRDVLEKTGFFDENLRRCEDVDLWMRTALCADTVYVFAPVAVYRRHAYGITQTVENEAVYMLRVMEKLVRLPLNSAQLARVLAAQHRLLLDSCFYHAQLGEIGNSLAYWIRAVRCRFSSVENIRYIKQLMKALSLFLGSGWRRA